MQAETLGVIYGLFAHLQKTVTMNIYSVETFYFFSTYFVLYLSVLIHTSIILSSLPHLYTLNLSLPLPLGHCPVPQDACL